MKNRKLFTVSLDDGVTQDIRAIEILNKYGMKGTFNLNSELLGRPGNLEVQGTPVTHNKVAPEKVAEIHAGHEVAVHTLTHPRLPEHPDAEVIRQVSEDQKNLTRLAGYEIIGMAYPCGGVNNDDRVAALIRENTPIRYSRTITSNYSFARQENLLRFDPTVRFLEWDKAFELGEQFLKLPEQDAVFYIWGHSYEFDVSDYWQRLEEFCRMMAGRDDIDYVTNKEALL